MSPDTQTRNRDIRHWICAHETSVPGIAGSCAVFIGPGFLHRDQIVLAAGAVVTGVIDPLAQEHYMGKLWTIPIVIGMLQEITDGLCRDNPKIELVINILNIHYLYYVTFALPECFQL